MTSDKIERAAKTEDTFSNIAQELLAKLEKEGKAEGTVRQKRRSIGLANADLADRPVSEITAAEILTAQPIGKNGLRWQIGGQGRRENG